MELCLMASHGYPPGHVLHPPEHGNGRLFKEHQLGWNHDTTRLCPFNPRLDQAQESLKPLIGKWEENKFLRNYLEVKRTGIVDLQDFPSYSVLFGFGVAEQCANHDRIARYIISRSNEEEYDGVTLSELLKLVGPQDQTVSMPQQSLLPYCEGSQSFLLPPSSSEFCSTGPLFLGALNHWYHTHLPDGQLSFTDDRMETKDVLLSLSEVFSSNKSCNLTKQAMVVPYFDRRLCRGAKNIPAESSLKLEPAKSCEKVRNGTSIKRSNMKVGQERDFYRNNYLHACESLLSLMVDKSRQDGTAILSLKRSGAELPNLLTQLSAGIAGTGLAVLFSVVCKVASGGVVFCTSKLFNTGLGIGLVWLSWAVNKLRGTVITINKTSGKFGVGEEEMVCSLDRSVREIYFRVATLMAVVILRFA